MPTRHPVSTQEGLDALAVYAIGVGLMKDRSAATSDDPFGWFYQSRMHGNPWGTERQPGEPEDWSGCQHGTWFFLPWHRMYLLQFEAIIRNLTNQPDWGLPYWDYPNATDVVVPAPFLDDQSPLYDQLRTEDPFVASEPTWMDAGSFVRFGGGMAERAHHGVSPGAVEDNPHNQVHSRFAGDLSSFQSPLDPLFWIHHANIDRLWEQWLQLGRENPTDSAWLNSSWGFPDIDDPSGRRTYHVSQIQTLAVAGYDYAPAPGEPQGGPERGTVARDDAVLTLVGASRRPGSVVETASVDLLAPEALGLGGPGADEEGAEAAVVPPLFLVLENVALAGRVDAVWNILVSAGGDPVLAGTLAPFGLAELTASGGRTTLTFDISRSAADLLSVGGPAFEVTAEQVTGEPGAVGPTWERAALYTSPA